jgi:hypothetical protein
MMVRPSLFLRQAPVCRSVLYQVLKKLNRLRI